MKISKTFRLSEEAVAELNERENATQFLEDLILNKAPAVNKPQVYSKAEIHIIDLLDKHGSLLQQLLENNAKPVGNKIPENTRVSPTANIEQLKSITGMTTADELTYEDML